MNRHALSCAVKARARGALSGHLPLVVAANLTFSAVFLLLNLAGAQMNVGNGIPGFVFSVILSWSLDVFFGLFSYGLQGIYLGLVYCRPVQQKDLFAGFSENTRQILLMQIFPASLKLAAMLPAFWAAFFLPLHTGKGRIIFAVLFAMGICLRLWIRLTYALSFFLLLDYPREGAGASLQRSRRLMKGYKLTLLYLDLSFLPYLAPVLCTFGIGQLWVSAYMLSARACFYRALLTEKTVSRV